MKRKTWIAVATVCLFVTAAAVCCGAAVVSRSQPAPPALARIAVGMTLDDTVRELGPPTAVMQKWNPVGGNTRLVRAWPADGGEIELTFGPDNRVVEKRFRVGEPSILDEILLWFLL